MLFDFQIVDISHMVKLHPHPVGQAFNMHKTNHILVRTNHKGREWLQDVAMTPGSCLPLYAPSLVVYSLSTSCSIWHVMCYLSCGAWCTATRQARAQVHVSEARMMACRMPDEDSTGPSRHVQIRTWQDMCSGWLILHKVPPQASCNDTMT